MTATVLPGMMPALSGERATGPRDKEAVRDISLYDYRTRTPAGKSRITLEQHLFSFIMEGEKKVSFSGSSTTLGEEECILLSAGNCLMTEKASPSGNYSSLLLFFDMRLLQDFLIKHPAKTPSHSISGGRAGVVTPAITEPFIRLRKDAFIRHYTGSLEQILSAGLARNRQMLLVKLEELFLYLSEKSPSLLDTFLATQMGSTEELEIRKTVEANLDRNCTLEEMAFLCHTSLSTFKRRFTRIYGESPNKWILRKKMEIAAGLLRQGAARPGEVGYQVGYKSSSSFTQAFKQIHGVTPKDFRKTQLTVKTLSTPDGRPKETPKKALLDVSQ
ncbi:MAG: AraC family transcriptional regulator [Puia sp.]|nr:AraC family transcriptional regulator [Puia sp.]